MKTKHYYQIVKITTEYFEKYPTKVEAQTVLDERASADIHETDNVHWSVEKIAVVIL